jgi:hypothetical protein
MLETQPGMLEEGARQVGAAPDAGHAAAEGRGEERGIPAVIGQFAPLHVAEQRLRRIEVRGVRGQPFHGQPPALLREIVTHPPAAVRGQPVPEQDDAPAPEMPVQLTEKADERGRRRRLGACLEEEATAPSVPAEGQRRGDRQPLPIAERVDQDRGFAPGRPRPSDDGLRREPAFVLEEEPGRWRRAFFLLRASVAAPTAEGQPRRARAPAAPGAAGTKEVAPKISRVGVLSNPSNPAEARATAKVPALAQTLGLTLLPLEVRSPGEFDGALVVPSCERADTLFVVENSLNFEQRQLIIDFAARNGLPAVFGDRFS